MALYKKVILLMKKTSGALDTVETGRWWLGEGRCTAGGSYLGGVREDEVFRGVGVAVEEVLHVVVGQTFQLGLANASQEVHGELHSYSERQR